MYTICSLHVLSKEFSSRYWNCNSKNNLSLYCGLLDAKIKSFWQRFTCILSWFLWFVMNWTFAIAHMKRWHSTGFEMPLLPFSPRAIFIFAFWYVIILFKMYWTNPCMFCNFEIISVHSRFPLIPTSLRFRYFEPPYRSGKSTIATVTINYSTPRHLQSS